MKKRNLLRLFLWLSAPVLFAALITACQNKASSLAPANLSAQTVGGAPAGTFPDLFASLQCGAGERTVEFTDRFFSDASLSNYTYYDPSWNPSTAPALDYSVSGGELLETPAAGQSFIGSYAVVNDPLFSHSLENYTVEADFKLDARTDNYGLFGLVFRQTAVGETYIFQWNGNVENQPPHWQMEKQTAPGGTSYLYLPGSGFGQGAATPAYTPGTWVHLKVVVEGNQFNGYVNMGSGDQLVFSVSDPNTPVYSSGGVGIRSWGLFNPNQLHVRDFKAFACVPLDFDGSSNH